MIKQDFFYFIDRRCAELEAEYKKIPNLEKFYKEEISQLEEKIEEFIIRRDSELSHLEAYCEDHPVLENYLYNRLERVYRLIHARK